MKILAELLIAIRALFIGVLFYSVFKSSGPWGSFWSFLLLLILAGIATNVRITPVGPYYQGVVWVPVMFVILLFAFLVASTTPPRRARIEKEMEEEPAVVALNVQEIIRQIKFSKRVFLTALLTI